MAAFVVAPLFLSGLVAGGAYVLSKTNYPGDTAAQTVMRRVNEQMQITQKGLDSENAAKKVQFEIEVLNSMLGNVPDGNKEQVRQSIDALAKELDRQKKGFYARKLNDDLRAVEDLLNGVTFTDEEISKIRSDLEACQRDINKASPEDRGTANANVMVLFDRLRDLESVHRDRSTVKDIIKVLGVTTTPQDIVAKKGMLYDIIGRLEHSAYAMRQDKSDANDALKRLDALSLSGTASTDTSDLGRVKMLARREVWDTTDMDEAKKLKQAIGHPSSQDAKNAIKELEDQEARMKPLIDLASHSNDIPKQVFERAVQKVDELATALKLKAGAGNAPSNELNTQAAKLMSHVKKLDKNRCKPPCSQDTANKIDAVQETLRTKFNISAASAAAFTGADSSGSFDYRLKKWKYNIETLGLFKYTKDEIVEELKTQTDDSKKRRLQQLIDSITKKDQKEKFNILKARFDSSKMPKKPFQKPLTGSLLKRELEDIGKIQNNKADEKVRGIYINNAER